MRQLIIVWSLGIACINNIQAQETLEQQLLLLEHKVYAETNDTLKNGYLVQKIQMYITSNVLTETVLVDVNRVDQHHLADSLQERYFWNAALLFYLNNDYRKSHLFLNSYIKKSGDTSVETRLFALLAARFDATYFKAKLAELVQVSDSFACLICLQDQYAQADKHLRIKKVASAILPGLGTIFNGYPVKGTFSLIFTASTVVLSYALFKNSLYINGFSWGLPLFQRFYVGNIRLTERSSDANMRRKKVNELKPCERDLQHLLNLYPINFK